MIEIERGASFGVSSPGQVEITTSGIEIEGRESVWATIDRDKRAVNAKKINELIFIIIALFVGLIRGYKTK
jgi:hypothetical protein